ncbi:CTP synthase [Patescibacteria group bacterium]|nr:CTP synthase [Patescibacteria group bacterium]MBU1563649.1 CTP synthase [Patescibacteria group bacterium]
MKKTRYIFVIGGVMSGIGKGITTASIGKILKSKGFKIEAIKIDPYINIDAGTMNPIEHGEVFVTEDGLETDQDLGNYERFLDQDIYADNYMTTGRVYEAVITRERNLGYKGRCVEVVPHIPEEVIRRIKRVGKKDNADFVLIEIGGTAGEYQNLLFLEAARMMHLGHPEDVLFVLVSYLPMPKKIGEMKTKPTQYATRTLNNAGIQPDFIIARSDDPLDEPRKRKISIFCNIDKDDVISAPDIQNIYEVPLNFEKDKLGDKILNKFGLKPKKKNFRNWQNLIKTIKNSRKITEIGIIGKYFSTGNFVLSDSYISVIEAVKHAAWHHQRKPKILWLNSEEYEKNPKKIAELKKLNGVIVPGGYGERGTEGKIRTIEFCRKNKIPYLGLCYGMQMAVIEFARNICGLKGAHTTEINPQTQYPVIDLMPEQKTNLQNDRYGGTMRLGAYRCQLVNKTKAQQAYKTKEVFERHRHRYEFNNDFRELLEEKGLVISGFNPERNLVEIIELKNHPFFVATQFHPEFKSRPLRPHPLFREFIRAGLK